MLAHEGVRPARFKMLKSIPFTLLIGALIALYLIAFVAWVGW